MADKDKTPRKHAPKYKNPSRYRLDFIKENTFNRIWSVRMTRARVIAVSAAICAAGAALLWVIIVYTPVRQLIPGTLQGDLRAQYIEAALKLDSLEEAARQNAAYINNIASVLQGDFDPESIRPDSTAAALSVSDSLLAASDAERMFVQRYRQDERFNLSVLAPIAAEGMIFTAPLSASGVVTPKAGGGIEISTSRATPVSAVYRGTVVSVTTAANGLSTITVQHPNDFVSVYSGVGDLFVTSGQKVQAGRRMAHTDARHSLTFELWHSGTSLDPREYIAF